MPIYQNTFIENIINDQLSVTHPYAAVSMPFAVKAAAVYPVAGSQLYYLPKQPLLDTLNNEFGDNVYLLQQLENDAYSRSSTMLLSTDELQNKLAESSHYVVDQEAFLKQRLFNILMGAWVSDWEWSGNEEEGKTIFRPLSDGVNSAFTKKNSPLSSAVLALANINGKKTDFGYTFGNVQLYNASSNNVDRIFTNRLTEQQWIDIATAIQLSLTDSTLLASVQALPKEVYSLSGNDILEKLKSRRSRLVNFASKYYKFLAKEVDVVGTNNIDHFNVTRLNNKETAISIFNSTDSANAVYKRIFKRKETEEIRLFGLNGKDVFTINGAVEKGINIKVIGGADKDAIIDKSAVKEGSKKTEVFDNRQNTFETSSETKLHFSNDTLLQQYQPNSYTYYKHGFVPSFFFNNEDRFYVSLGYKIQKWGWRKTPFHYQHGIYVRYSLDQAAFDVVYKGFINQFWRKWNLALNANYDAVRWTNFFGLGNESPPQTLKNDYYWMRTRDLFGSVGINRQFRMRHSVSLSTFYQSIKIINDTDRFVGQKLPADYVDLFSRKSFAGSRFNYIFQHRNDPVLPTKGILLGGSIAHTFNVKNTNRSFTNYSAQLQLQVPLSGKFVYATRNGISTVTGSPEFYQMSALGGGQNLRGYRRDRFWGKTAFYNSNEIQWITPFRSRLFNGRVGLLGFFDEGRVWLPGESSNTWHTGYGGGIILAPFNKIMASVTYGLSKEYGIFHLRFSGAF